MSKTADAEDGDHIAGSRPAVTKRIEGGDAGAHQGGRLKIREVVRKPRQGFYGRDHVLGIAPVIANARHKRALAEDKIASAAWFATAAMSSVPPHADPLARFPVVHARTDRIDDPGNFMSRNTGKPEAGPQSLLGENVAVADPASLHLDENLSRSGLGDVALYELQRPSRLSYFHCFHLSHPVFSF
jgi:hypothetical protein